MSNYKSDPTFTILMTDCPKCNGWGEHTSEEGDFQVMCEKCEGSGSVPDDREPEFEPEEQDRD